MKTVVTGDRPTGPLHLGHFVGSLQQRIRLQETHRQFVLIADVQALTDHFEDPEFVRWNIEEVMLDYLAVGLEPGKTTFVLQSHIREIAELSVYFCNLVTLGRLERNPTVKDEMKQKGYGANVPVGFLTYPVHQAADIAVFDADLVPVGEDQLPMIEQTREVVRSFNRTYGPTLLQPKALLSKVPRLPGIYGKGKMSKTVGNTIQLKASKEDIERLTWKMYTDPARLRPTDPGRIEGNVVFSYLEAFDPDKEEVDDLKQRYREGRVSDAALKYRLAEVLNDLLEPIRARRSSLERRRSDLRDMLLADTERARTHASSTMARVRKALFIE